ncbi:spore coat polysaccharide biosynthesis protein SpsF [Clostridium algifaecis]|uniref:Spore coat polysaccharide biosynthesis protein SpsF n=1 Tax=Clostridium algifaecis TaxID=1472040 RepID=A0ABS4KVX6_9CLOT|nr:glycosyltransferase family protein [Clostridium algifaecis]MBP2033800.1 spore coat polysaccharide biosynthesis protein SpsF [Clostridium algifaecis]
MNVVCIMQARTGSTRLPGKVLKKICSKTVLEHDIDRLKRVKNIDKIVIATTTLEKDNAIVEEAKRLDVAYFRGSEEDVLSRYYYAAKENNTDVVVRVTSDCPLIDSEVTEKTVQYYIDNRDKYDYVSNTYERTFPRGFDTEIFSFKLLERAFKETNKKIYREHVTTYFWKNPRIFKIGCYKSDVDYSKYRLTLDTEEDFKLIKTIYDNLYYKNECFGFKAIIELFKNNSELYDINKMIEQKNI